MNLIQQKQVNNLEADFSTLSGNINATGQLLDGFLSGDSTFSGNKTFTGSGIFNTGVDVYGALTVYNKGTFAEVGVNLPRHGTSGFMVTIPSQPNYGDPTPIPRGVQVRERNVLIASGNLHVSGSLTHGGRVFVSGVNGQMLQLIPHWNLAGPTLNQDLYFTGGGTANGNVMMGFDKTDDHASWFTAQALNVSGNAKVIGDITDSGSLTVSTDITAGADDIFKYTSSTKSLNLGDDTLLNTGGLFTQTGDFNSGIYLGNQKIYPTNSVVVQDSTYTGVSNIPNILVDSNTYGTPITITLRNPVAETNNYEPLGVCNAYNVIDIGGNASEYPITIRGSGTATINGGQITISENSGGYNIFTNGQNWFSAGYSLQAGVHAKGEDYQIQIRSGSQGKFAGAVGLTYNYTNHEVTGMGNSHWFGDISTNGVVRASGITLTGSQIPSSTSSAGESGQIAVDTSHLYVCIGTNSWKRAEISGWS